MSERRRYRVFGRVQGVGFRAYVWREVRPLELAGWVRNRFDGSVEVLADGSADAHRCLLGILERGPRLSDVERVETTTEPAGGERMSSFQVISDA